MTSQTISVFDFFAVAFYMKNCHNYDPKNLEFFEILSIVPMMLLMPESFSQIVPGHEF